MQPRLLRHARKDPGALQRNSAHSLAAAHALVCYQSNAVYSFIPKNGCTTLRLSLAIANGCIAGPEDVVWVHANNATFTASLRDLATARFTFVVLRCPYARLASVFMNKIVRRKPEYWQLDRLEGDRLRPETVTFRSFVEMLAQPKRLRANVHWRPQSDFLVYDTYDAYYALEDFAAAAQDIQKQAGFAVVDARPVIPHGTSRVTLDPDGCFADTPLSDLEQMQRAGRLPAHAAFYDSALIAQATRLYAADIRLYSRKIDPQGLTFPAPDLKGQTQ